MNNIFLISKYALKEQFFPYYPSKRAPGMPKNYLARLLVLIFTYLSLGYLFLLMSMVSVKVFVEMGLDYMYFTIFAMMVTIMIFSIYIANIMAGIFSEKAISNYQTLPIKEEELFVGKILGGCMSFVDYYIFFILVYTIYARLAGFDFLSLVLGLVNFFPMVIIPYTLVSLLIMLVKRFSNVNSHKKLFKNIGFGIMFVILGVIYYFAFSQNQSDVNFSKVFSDVFVERSFVSNIFFNAKLFGLSITGPIGSRLISSIILYCLSGGLLALSYKLAQNNYYRSVFGKAVKDEKKAKKSSGGIKNVSLSQSSQFKALVKRDLKVLMNEVMFLYSPILMALIFGIICISSGRNMIEDIDMAAPYSKWVILAGGYFIGFLIWSNGGIAQNALSREGKSFYLIQTLPIDPHSHMLARLTSASLISTGINLVLAVVVGLVLKFSLVNILAGFVGLYLGAFISNIIGVFLSTIGINVTWTNPKDLMNNGGFRVFGYYLLSLLFVFLNVGIGVFIMVISEGNMPYLAIGLPVLLNIIIALLFYLLAKKRYSRGFMDI